MTPPTTAWHVPPRQFDAYLAERVDAPIAASIEAHLIACAQCRSALAERSDPIVAAASWAAIEIAVDAEPVSLVERLGARLGIADRDIRTLAPTLPQQAAWWAATFLALLAAATMARGAGGTDAVLARLVFLTLAPVGPLAAVVTALGTASEPAGEIARTTPASRLRIGALRAATALTVALAMGLAASLVLPGPWLEAMAWLLPGLALSALGAFVAGRASQTVAVGTLSATWIALVLVAARLADDRLAAFRPGPQLAYLIIALVAAALLAVRDDSLHLGRIS
jgi:hypothetical protein